MDCQLSAVRVSRLQRLFDRDRTTDVGVEAVRSSSNMLQLNGYVL